MAQVALYGSEVCGRCGKVAIVIDAVAADRPSNPLFLNFVRPICCDHADVGCFLVHRLSVMGGEEYSIRPLWYTSADALHQLANLVCLYGSLFGAFAAMQEGADFEHSAGGRVDSGAGEEGTLGLDGVDGEGRYVVEMPCGEGVLGCLWRIVTMGVGLLHGRLDVIGWWSSFSRVFRWGINN